MKRFLAGGLALLLSLPAPFAFAGATNDLHNDMIYYQRTATRENMGANDRLYILNRLKMKYEGKGADLSELENEIARIEKKGGGLKTTPAAPSRTPVSRNPQLTQIRLKQENQRLKVILSLNAAVAPQAYQVDDPKYPDGPVLLIDFPKTANGVSPVSRDMRWDSGPLAAVVAAEEEKGTLRVRLEMRGKRAYRVLRSGQDVTVEFKNDAAEAVPVAVAQKAEPEQTPERKARDSYVIQSGDLLNIQVTPARELSREAIVQPDGTLVFPLLGNIPVKGMTVAELQKTMTGQLKAFVSRPEVNISIKQFSNRNVFFMGKVSRPGPFPYKPGLGLLNAISQAGGFQEDADRTKVRVYRGEGEEKKSIQVNAQEILAQGDLSKDFPLEPGDIIEVARGGSSVFIIGQVLRPGTYAFREGYTLLELVSEAGGVPLGAKTAYVQLFRQTEKKRLTMRVNLARVMKGDMEHDIPLQPGDIIVIPQSPLYTSSSVITTVISPWLSLIAIVLALVIAGKR